MYLPHSIALRYEQYKEYLRAADHPLLSGNKASALVRKATHIIKSHVRTAEELSEKVARRRREMAMDPRKVRLRTPP